MKEKREKRLNSEFQREIYDIIKNRIKNPDITEMFSITEVDVTNDLSHAKVFVSVFSTDETRREKTFNAISDSAKAVRCELGKRMRIRTVPELHFTLDTAEEYGRKIDALLGQITYSDGDEG